ncbi:MAG: RNA methyltransferase [Clostridiales bacterium]|nr:RNA methyltransferase [Clostridiales bacterium]
MITSKQNSLIKEIRSLSDKKNRDKLGVYVIEGVKPVKEAIDIGLSIRDIIVSEKLQSTFLNCNLNVQVVSDEVFKSVSEEVCPQGALAVVYKPQTELTAPKGSCVLLDGVSDPSNVGAIIRTAVASGYNDLYMTDDCADAYSQKAVRCSMSGVFRLNIMRASIDEILKVISLPICVADMGGQNVFNLKNDKNVCLVIGNEGHGVSQKVRDRADIVVSIPMQNQMESLNASVSAGILMYALKNHNNQ